MVTYDIHFQLLATDELEDLSQQHQGRVFTFGFQSAVGVRGPQKLLNRWVKCLLTLKGSDPLNKEYGTNFPNLFGSNITTTRDFIDAVNLFIEDCNTQIRALDRKNNVPDDERLQSATLAKLVPRNEDGFDIYVNISNAAGLIVPLQLPAIAKR